MVVQTFRYRIFFKDERRNFSYVFFFNITEESHVPDRGLVHRDRSASEVKCRDPDSNAEDGTDASVNQEDIW